ncbi:hypothetical protein [uncultured Campylobacter sp.]|uniref:hypothetical protein n=1 Tax=uncultured Campylobacter sp. TaxID=218934 RepID=UPI00260A2FA4|nr:hypothetical protein [uncultured Campylobacter sp.]
MDYLYQSALSFHKFFALAAAILTIIYLIFTQLKIDAAAAEFRPRSEALNSAASAPQAENLKQKSRSGLRFLRRIRLFLPIYYATLAALIISGSVMLPVLRFDLSFRIYFMAAAALAMIILSAVSYKRLKIAYLSQNFAPYQRKMRVILGLSLAIILIASVI